MYLATGLGFVAVANIKVPIYLTSIHVSESKTSRNYPKRKGNIKLVAFNMLKRSANCGCSRVKLCVNSLLC